MEIYRTFIGIPVEVDREFLRAREEMIARLEGERISWVDPGRYHLTLRFIGETRISMVGKIGRALRQIPDLPKKTRLRLGDPGSFGPRARPRVVWAGLEDGGMLPGLKARVDRVLKGCGMPPPEQPFRAHLTLGRIRSLKNLEGYYDTLHAMSGRYQSEVLLDRLVFYRSELTGEGPLYTPLEVLEFKD